MNGTYGVLLTTDEISQIWFHCFSALGEMEDEIFKKRVEREVNSGKNCHLFLCEPIFFRNFSSGGTRRGKRSRFSSMKLKWWNIWKWQKKFVPGCSQSRKRSSCPCVSFRRSAGTPNGAQRRGSLRSCSEPSTSYCRCQDASYAAWSETVLRQQKGPSWNIQSWNIWNRWCIVNLVLCFSYRSKTWITGFPRLVAN